MHGKCLCGSVEFKIFGNLPRLYQCHCSLCRKQGGSLSNTATIVGAENFCWLSSQEHIATWVKDTGFRSDFCSKCGSPVPNPLRNTAYYWVPIGLLYGKHTAEIAAHVFVGSKAAYEVISPQGVHFEKIPALSEFIALLHSGKND